MYIVEFQKVEITVLTAMIYNETVKFKVALGVCFALKSLKEYLLLFIYLITLGKDVTFP